MLRSGVSFHPHSLAERQGQPLLLLGQARDALPLEWRSAQGQAQRVLLDGLGCTFSEDMDSLVGLARAGSGVVLAPDYCVAQDLKAGSLVENSSQGGGTKDTWILETPVAKEAN